ncbi:hypothetical protein CU669_17755 [Paramagnetospirillum kuznetsovii]|uniref:Uncharacterized protein n=1 Tax=Paramagnetospirillum kuznetsovii TaxID=2053833 RepID=A0A364NUI8_9PROT|nr:ATP-binding protein [Paramagnetospirillum kuznetsovii]RAU20585.1 hypothetical protein CU669_17755 [Paramagnetospirillum kuznetsovii]
MTAARHFGPDSLAACLEEPAAGGIELDDIAPVAPGRHFLRHLSLGGFGLVLSTATAYQCEVALIFSKAVRRRFSSLDDHAPGLERAIHELVANALVHGNLAVPSPKMGMEGFDDYCRMLDQALADPIRQGRRLEISAARSDADLEISVRDQGAGYEFCRFIDPSEDAQPRQHGLAIIAEAAELIVEESGRCSLIRFPGAAP